MQLFYSNQNAVFIIIALLIAALYGFALRYALFNKLPLSGKLICLIAIFVVPILGAFVITVYFRKHPEEL